MNKNNSVNKNMIGIIVFLVIAAVLAIIAFLAVNSGNSSEKSEMQEDRDTGVTAVVSRENKDSEKTTESVTEAATEPVTEPHVSPTKVEWDEMSSEKSDIGAVLKCSTGNDDDKQCHIPLNELALSGDILESFTFYFHAEDENKKLENVQLGFGISVYNSCEARTHDIWYQDPEVKVFSDDSGTGSITWQVPDVLKDYINIPSGNVLFGYWYSEIGNVVLDRVVCHKKKIYTIPVDGDVTFTSGKVLKTSEGNNILNVPLSEFIEEGQTLECVEITFEGSDVISELCGKFGVDTKVLSDKHYNGVSVITSSDDNTAKLKWLPVDVVKKGMDTDGNLEFILERCSLPEITVKDIYVQYAIQ